MVPYVQKTLLEVLGEKRFADLPVLMALVEMMRRRDVDPDPEDSTLRLVASMAQGPGIADEDIIRLRHFAGVTSLDLSSLALREESLDAIPEDVQNLAMVDVPLTDVGIVRLLRLNRLTRLNLEGTRITDSGLDRLGAIRSLRWLNVKRTRVTRAGVDRLKANLPDLEVAS
jgi:hypothetical protein